MTDPYASHLPVLRAIGRNMPIRRVLEFGGGAYSTPEFLDRNSFPVLEKLVTVERNTVWSEKLVAIEDVRFTLRSEWEDPRGYDLIFIDDGQNAAERVATIEAVAESSPSCLVLIHDFEVKEYREAAKKLGQWAYVLTGGPQMGILWNGQRPPDSVMGDIDIAVKER